MISGYENKGLKSPNNCATLECENHLLDGWLHGASAEYETIRFPDGSIAFRVDRRRGLVEVQRRGTRYVFDLAGMGNARTVPVTQCVAGNKNMDSD